MNELCAKDLGRVRSKSLQKHGCITSTPATCVNPAELPRLAVGELGQLDVNLTKVITGSVKLWKMHKINSKLRDWTNLSTTGS